MNQRTIPDFAIMAALVATLSVGTLPANAAKVPRTILKTYFETGDVPTEEQFSNLLDSYIHKTDDGLTLYAFGTRSDSSGTNYLRVGSNVGINETLPDTTLHAWRKAPVPNIPPIPGMCPSFCGAEHAFLPLQYVGPDGTSFHYAFLQLSMESDSVATLAGGGGAGGSVDPGPAIFAEYLVWETTPGATLTTFMVPEPATAALLLLALVPLTLRRCSR